MEQWLLGVYTSVHVRASNKHPGFTLIELMIAVTIIAVLIVIASTTFSYAQKLSRDGRRISDLRSIEAALELYFAKNKAYPCRTTTWQDSIKSTILWIGAHATTQEPLTPIYLRAVPIDPLNNTGYAYWGICGTQSYKIMARMELANKLAQNDGGVCPGWYEIFSPILQSFVPNTIPPNSTVCTGP